ncbi:MAG: GNAT family N-acetyltransferase, partial [Myxococcota bacterium]
GGPTHDRSRLGCLSSGEFGKATKEERGDELRARVSQGDPVGVFAICEGEPVAWVSVGPRETFAGLERSKTLARVDDQPVWSITCMFIAPSLRRRKVTERLIEAAASYARSSGASIVEAYPVEATAASYTYMGTPGTLERCGFSEVTPDDRKRRVFRRRV